ncbi:PAS domain-containing sensor histidine kinase [Methylobacterium sp. GC_Met_2]|uniref:hybrid sensor histidine kinase/response regulator n=1 Tax=Methylobacterium sp. GC_Met_2 TaxID=2937376 RepID=UPI00226BA1AE|nr:PAS domain-containing sensor histidine kinase [Methylobacterium sp. GC_Met_2]
MGALIRAHDWSSTTLGPVASWPQALRTALRLILNTGHPMYVFWGEDSLCFYNDAYRASIGNERHPSSLGCPAREVWAETWDIIGPQIEQVTAGRGATWNENHLIPITRNGRREDVYWTYSYSPIDAEGAVNDIGGVLVACTETTAQVLTERRLREANETLEKVVRERTKALRLFGNIVQSDRAPILAYDHDLRVIGFNKAHDTAFQRVMGRHQRTGDLLLDFFPPDQAQTLRGLMERALAGESFSVTEVFGDPDHELPTWEITYSPLIDEEGTIFGAFHVARDVSERVRAQEELATAQEALRQSQKLEAIGQLTGGVAHDFNNLLTVIKSSTDLLKRPDLADARRQRYVAAISDTVDRAAKLTGQLLAFARRQALKPEVFDACDSVRALSDMIGTLAGARIAIVTDLPEQSCFVDADPSQFDTALVNMAVNARDAMGGEGRLTIRVGDVQRMPSARQHAAIDGDFVAITVTDTGSGISAKHLGQIFEPFFTTKGVGQGTGLGLSQVFGFAKQSGGEITVESEIGRGTTFTLYLPRVAAPASTVTDDEPPALVDGHGTCVLVVEDNAEVGTFAVQTLSNLGYVPVLAGNAEEALVELAKDADRFDVVFSDVVMPSMNGIELGQEIRRLYNDLPVLLASGYSHILAQSGTHGFELLHKPYSVEQLSRLLRKVGLRHRRKRIISQ